ncbi:TonB-dependent receptor [Pseudoalteromonas sp. S16_S37]|uniref:TonB-dependent receptor n=1 Tax=Pseudoalteromonas sp. S16_S37 TaxID=2720228 RepID=UPI00168133F2|nr:TonB-dependent receptor [Pseudoalteromonas sp. S16_S37]MBD1584613.1 TonB-dependent receptor [Pseudoalteromonas sp. S16_S37]
MDMKKKTLTLIASALLCAFNSHGVLADDAQANKEHERILVTANRTEQKISDIAGTVWLVDLEQLQAQVNAGNDFKTSLAQLVPSLDLASTTRTNYAQNMRGRQMVVMIDGVSLNSSRGISRHLDAIDPFNISRIEVLSGTTAIYGGGSTGGVINIITKQGNEDNAVRVGVHSGFAGSDDFDTSLAGAYGFANAQTKGRVSIAYNKVQAMYDGNGDAIIMDTTQSGLQYTDSLDVMASISHKFTETQSISAMVQKYKNESDGEHGLYFGPQANGLFGDMTGVEIRKGLDSAHTPKTERTLINLNYVNSDVFSQTLNVQAFAREEIFDFYPRPRLSGDKIADFSSSEQNTHAHGFKFVLSGQTGKLSYAYGFDYDSEEFDSLQTYYDKDIAQNSGGLVMKRLYAVDRYPGFEVDASALFAQLQYQVLDNLAVSTGYRRQNMDNTVHDFVGTSAAIAVTTGSASSAETIKGGSTDYSVNLFNLGLVYDLSDSQQVWFNSAEAFELPNVAKFYGQGKYEKKDGTDSLTLVEGTVVDVNNSALAGIKTDSMELGWRFSNGALSAQAAAYYSTSDHKITYDNKTLLIAVSDAKTRTRGIEAQLDYDFNAAWRAGISAHVISSEAQDKAGDWKKVSVTQASSSKFTSYLAWQANDLNVRLQSKTMFDLDDDANGEIDGYTLFDLSASYPLASGKVQFAVNNLFDKAYTTQWGKRAIYFYSPKYGPNALYDHKGRGRSFALTYQYNF